MSAYLYPNGPQNRLANVPGTATSCPGGDQSTCAPFLPQNQRDTSWNDQQIVKLQYQKNFGSSAYLRLYGYTYYSDWLMNGPVSTYDNVTTPGTGYGLTAPDYELTGHTRGVSANFSDQINQQNLISLQGSYTTSTSTRDNNTQMFNGLLSSYVQLIAVNAADPYSGYCYGAAGGAARFVRARTRPPGRSGVARGTRRRRRADASHGDASIPTSRARSARFSRLKTACARRTTS